MNIKEKLYEVANLYPDEMIEGQVKDIDRIAFNINLGINACGNKSITDLEICDLGGGIGLFLLGCAALGFRRTVLIDDFNDDANRAYGNTALKIHRNLKIEVISRDVVKTGISDITGMFDVITSFDSMEHWHDSPKTLFNQVLSKLKPGGAFVLGVPNCVNLLKRITVPLGLGKWSRMEDWYEPEKFRGHVREPDVSDLRYIARDMGLGNLKIYGRNWLGYHSSNKIVRMHTAIADGILRFQPSLCSNIYMVGNKV